MTQIVVTLENGADTNLLQRMIENMKGVLKTSLKRQEKTNSNEDEVSEWMKNLKSARDLVDPSVIDMNDERTRYIMSK